MGGADVLDEPPLLPIEVAVVARLLKANKHMCALEVRGLGPNRDTAEKVGTNDVLRRVELNSFDKASSTRVEEPKRIQV